MKNAFVMSSVTKLSVLKKKLDKDGSVTIHIRNLLALATDM